MKLQFIKVSPAQNMTIYVLDQILRENHIAVANKLLDYGNLYAEQVGFIEKSGNHIRLQMMGGEFCGNATRSLAAIIVDRALDNVREVEDGYLVSLETSGLEKVVKCKVRKTDEKHIYKSEIEMPLPIGVSKVEIEDSGQIIELTRVDFPGISHFIVKDEKVKDRDKLYNLVKIEMEKEDYDAFGIMYYDYETDFMIPLVYVKPTNSLYWEKSCGSGTTAMGVVLAKENKTNIRKTIRQPGGELEIDIEWANDKISKISLDGPVNIVAEGIVYI